MWIADGWEDYELLDCGGGEKLERWGKQILVRPDPQAIWETPRTNRGWRNAQGRYYRSSSGGGHWDKEKLPESWTVNYKDLKFQVKPMNFKHTGLFPEQAVNWDFAREKIKNAGRPIRVLNLFAYTGGATVACGRRQALRSATWMRQRAWSTGRARTRVSAAFPMRRCAGSSTTARNLSSVRSAAARCMTPSSWTRRATAAAPEERSGSWRTIFSRS